MVVVGSLSGWQLPEACLDGCCQKLVWMAVVRSLPGWLLSEVCVDGCCQKLVWLAVVRSLSGWLLSEACFSGLFEWSVPVACVRSGPKFPLFHGGRMRRVQIPVLLCRTPKFSLFHGGRNFFMGGATLHGTHAPMRISRGDSEPIVSKRRYVSRTTQEPGACVWRRHKLHANRRAL